LKPDAEHPKSLAFIWIEYNLRFPHEAIRDNDFDLPRATNGRERQETQENG
jgi:hypothetical protein